MLTHGIVCVLYDVNEFKGSKGAVFRRRELSCDPALKRYKSCWQPIMESVKSKTQEVLRTKTPLLTRRDL